MNQLQRTNNGESVFANPDELPDHEVDVVLKHDDIVPFLRHYLRKRNPVMLVYWIFNVILLVAAVFSLMEADELFLRIGFLLLGFTFFFLLIPLHELIHGIGYRLAGARKVTYRAVWRKLLFYAMADRFFITKISFVVLAIAPFLLINSLLMLVVIAMSGSYLAWLSAGALFMHTAGCAGDFALISYFFEKWKLDPVVCDDVENGQTWFYLKKSSRSPRI